MGWLPTRYSMLSPGYELLQWGWYQCTRTELEDLSQRLGMQIPLQTPNLLQFIFPLPWAQPPPLQEHPAAGTDSPQALHTVESARVHLPCSSMEKLGLTMSLFSVPPFCHCFYFNKSLLVLSWWHMSGSKISNALENVFAAVFMYLTLRRERKEHYMEVRGCMGRPDYKTVNKITCSPED